MMPKGRYKIMTAYMPKVGTLRPRHDVPHLHGADEPRLLLRSRHGEEAARLARAAAGRRPRCSPTRRSPKASRTASCRSARRSGATPTTSAPACCRGRSSPAWASSATSTTRSTCRCISSSAATSYIDVSGKSFRDHARRQAADARRARHASRTGPTTSRRSFPEVRLKRYLEMRGSDGGPWRRLPALPAFWVGLLYDDAALDACWDMVKDWTAEERQKLRDDVPRLGFKATIRGRSVLELAQEMSGARRAGAGAPQAARPRRPRRDALSAAAAGDRRARHHAGRGAAGKIPRAVERLGRADLRRV